MSGRSAKFHYFDEEPFGHRDRDECIFVYDPNQAIHIPAIRRYPIEKFERIINCELERRDDNNYYTWPVNPERNLEFAFLEGESVIKVAATLPCWIEIIRLLKSLSEHDENVCSMEFKLSNEELSSKDPYPDVTWESIMGIT